MATPYLKNQEFFYFCYPFCRYHYYKHVYLYMLGGREEDFQRNNAFSLYNLYVHGLAQEPLHQR